MAPTRRIRARNSAPFRRDFFASLGVPIIAGRDFNDADRQSGEQVVIISQSVALRMFHQEAVNRHLQWTDPVIKFIPGFSEEPRRIIGVTADLDDEHVIPGPQLTVYHPFEQFCLAGACLCTPAQSVWPGGSDYAAGSRHVRGSTGRARRDSYGCARGSAVFGPVELHCVWRICVGGAGHRGCGRGRRIGVFRSARTREFGIRLAIGSQPRSLLTGVIAQGMIMAGLGIVAGAGFGYA